MNFKEKVRLGLYTEKNVEIPEGMQHCLNCGCDYEGAYCPRCGQYWKVKRITFANMVDTIVSVCAGFQANLPRTIIDLFYRPGYLVADYIGGKRRVYTNPFSALLLIAALTILVEQLVLGNDVAKLTNNCINSYANVLGDPEIDEVNNNVTTTLVGWAYSFYGLYNLCLIPFIGIPFWIAFRRQGRYKDNPLNIYEAFVAVGFFACAASVVSALLSPFFDDENVYGSLGIFMLFILPILLLMVWQLFGMKLSAFLFRTFIVFPLCMCMLELIFIIAVAVVCVVCNSLGFNLYA